MIYFIEWVINTTILTARFSAITVKAGYITFFYVYLFRFAKIMLHLSANFELLQEINKKKYFESLNRNVQFLKSL